MKFSKYKHVKLQNKAVDFFLFCTSSIGIIGILPIIYSGQFPWMGAFLQFFVSLYLLIKKSPLFGHSLFFLLFTLTFQIPFIPSMWVFNLLVANALYFIIVFSSRSIKRAATWLKLGHINKAILFWIIYIICLSSIVLILWASFIKSDLSGYRDSFPEVNIVLLLVGIVGFSVSNGALEEFMFRGIFCDALEKIFDNVIIIIIIQSVFFGLIHFDGFPGGVLGIGLSIGYGFVLGIFRYKSQGILAPTITHIFADITISVILMVVIDKI